MSKLFLFVRVTCGLLPLLILGAAASSAPKTVTLDGTAQDCATVGQVLRAAHVKVSAFQLSKARPIKAHLDSMNHIRFKGDGTDGSAFEHLDNMYVLLQKVVGSTRALSRDTSAVNGTFTLNFAPTDSVLIVGYQPQEDQDFYYSSALLAGTTSQSVILDMSRGACGF
jgi:hypothetical protein